MLKKRLLTAVLLIIFVLAGLFFLPPLGLVVVLLALFSFAAWEWSHLMGLTRTLSRFFYTVFLFVAMLGSLFVPLKLVLLFGVLFWLFAAGVVIVYARTARLLLRHVFLQGLSGLFVIVPCYLGLLVLRESTVGPMAVVALLLLIWSADTGAYFIGRRFGKHVLALKVSPGKTWEGFFGGLIAASLVAMLETVMLDFRIDYALSFIGLALVTILFSVVGDLFESLMKRQQGLKDSGTLLPGHGGLLDRIDSLTAAVPIFVLGIACLGNGV